jgi:hypothetical protein
MHSEVIEEKGKMKNKKNSFQLDLVIKYFYLLGMSIFMVALYSFVEAQIACLLIINCLYLIYLLKKRPYINAINTIFGILNILVLIAF